MLSTHKWMVTPAKINEIDNDGNTPLHAAASRGSLEMLKFLVSKGAEPAKLNYHGQKPLDFAIISKQQEAIDYSSNLK